VFGKPAAIQKRASGKLAEQLIEVTRICDGQTADKAPSWRPRLHFSAITAAVKIRRALVLLSFRTNRRAYMVNV